MFQLYNFYVLYVLNTSHKVCMKLHMVFELSISFPVFKIPPPRHCAGGTHPTGMHTCISHVIASFSFETGVHSFVDRHIRSNTKFTRIVLMLCSF